LQAQLKTAQPSTRPKFLIELANPTPKEKLFLKNFQRFKNKNRNAQPRLNDTTTQQRQWFTSTVDRTPAPNSTYKKLAVQCLV
jgi:hypothetical protein